MDTPSPNSPDALGIDGVIDRVLAGTASPADHAVVDAWASDPVRVQWLAVLRESRAHAIDTEATLARIKAAHADASAVGVRTSRPNTRVTGGWAAGTAALMALVAIGFGMWKQQNRSQTTASLPTGARYATAIGQRAVVTLEDGSRVTLAPQTVLQVAPKYGKTARTVTLHGEAQFEVNPGRGAPFIVQTGAVTTRVLGTTFTVRRYAEDRDVRVAVLSGRVHVSATTGQRRAVTVAAGTMGVATDSSATLMTTGSMARYTEWVRGQLVFHEAPVTEILAALTRWYGYQFRLADSTLTTKNFTLGLSTESSREALATLKLMLDVNLSFDGSVVTLSPRRATSTTPALRHDPQQSLSPRSREVGR